MVIFHSYVSLPEGIKFYHVELHIFHGLQLMYIHYILHDWRASGKPAMAGADRQSLRLVSVCWLCEMGEAPRINVASW